VGRVTEQLLLHHFQEVDMLEPSRHLLTAAEERCGNAVSSTASDIPPGNILGQTFCMGLQQFTPQRQKYDSIWIQWALLYLTDGALYNDLRSTTIQVCKFAQSLAVG